MPCSNDAPPDDGQPASPSTDSYAISEVEAEVVSDKPGNVWLERAEIVLMLASLCIIIPILSLRFLLFHREITFRQARQIRAALLRNRTWKWWHIGLTPWFTINWMLMMFDEKKDVLSHRIKSGKRALDAFSHVRLALVKDGDMHVLFDLWQEFQDRDEAAFDARDRSFFMARMGTLFSRPARVFIETAMLLRMSDYLVFKYLCCKTCRYMDARIIRVGIIESTLVTYFIEHKAECCQRIQHFKPTILKMARRYVENMIAFCIRHGLTPAAHLWAQAGKCVIHLQELDPTDDNEPVLRREVEKFLDAFEQASTQVYVKYQELDRAERERQQALALAAPDVDTTSEEGVAAVTRWPFLHREKVGRFKFKWDGRSLTITDTAHRESDHSSVKFEDITAPQALDILEQLIKAYADGYGKLILPLDKPSWQASMDGAAADFIKRETETWSDAHPSDQKEVKRFHNRDRRIIPDGQPLREF